MMLKCEKIILHPFEEHVRLHLSKGFYSSLEINWPRASRESLTDILSLYRLHVERKEKFHTKESESIIEVDSL